MDVRSQLKNAQVEHRGSNPTKKGEIVIQTADSNQVEYHDGSAVRTVVNTDQAQVLTGKTVDADLNTLSNIKNAEIKAGAAIAVNKLAAVTASRALVSDGSGFISPATTTATEIGYVNGVTSAIQTQLDGKVGHSTLTSGRVPVTGASNTVSSSSVTSTELGYLSGVTSAIQTQLNALGGTLSVSTKTGNYTANSGDNVLLCDSTSGAFTITLYTAVGNTGRTLVIQKTDSSFNVVTVDGDSTETVGATTSVGLSAKGDSLTIVSDGSNWKILSFVSEPVVARIDSSGNQSINNTTWTKVTNLATAVIDTIGGWDGTNDRYYFRTSGLYEISCFVEFAASSSGIRVASMTFNGGSVPTISGAASWSTSGDTGGQTRTYIYSASANDYVECAVYQGSGGSLNLTGAQLSIKKIGR